MGTELELDILWNNKARSLTRQKCEKEMSHPAEGREYVKIISGTFSSYICLKEILTTPPDPTTTAYNPTSSLSISAHMSHSYWQVGYHITWVG